MSNANAAGEKRAVASLAGRSARVARADFVACANDAYVSRLRKGRAFGAVLVALVAAVFAVGLVAFPGNALADDVITLTQTDFDNEGGIYVIDGDGSYKLGGNVSGAIKISKISVATTIDLNGKTLTCPSGTTADAAIDIENWGVDKPSITIKNGSIVHEKDGGLGIGMWRRSTSLTLEDLNVSVTNSFCVNAYGSGSSLTIRRGSYVINKTNPYVMNASTVMAYAGTVTVDQYAATFTINGGDDVVKADGGAISLKGGDFNKFPSQASIYGGYAMFKSDASDSTWDVKEEEAARNSSLNGGASSGWVVAVDGFGKVYFSSEAEAAEFAKSKGAEVATAAVAKVGDTYYASLKAAVNAADSGSKVELLQDTTDNITVDGKSLAIDLGRHTLNAPDTKEAITKKGSGTLSVCNGTISCKQYCIFSSTNDASSNVTLTNVSASSTSTRAVYAEGSGSVAIESGEYSSVDDDYEAVSVSGNAKLAINGGSFMGANGVDVICQGTSSLSISGGDFSNVKPVSYVVDGRSMQYKDDRYYVVDTSTDDAVAAVKLNSGWVLTTSDDKQIYYGCDGADKSKAESDQDALSSSELKQIFHVAFNDCEDKLVEKRAYVAGDGLVLPAEPTRTDYTFQGWLTEGRDKAVAGASVTADATYTATWKVNGCAKIESATGTRYFGSLQDGVNTATSGDTVVLLKDTTENVTIDKSCGEFTIDLNDFTLTERRDLEYAVGLEGPSQVVITNGKIVSADYGIQFFSTATGAKLTLRDGEHGLSVSTTTDGGRHPIMASSGNNNTLIIESGTYTNGCHGTAVSCMQAGSVLEIGGGKFTTSDGTDAVRVENCTTNVSGGWFSNSIYKGKTASLTITGGNFGNDNDKAYVADGYAMRAAAEEGRYEVVKDTFAPAFEGLEADGLYEGSTSFTVSDDSSVSVMAGGMALTPDASGNYTLSEATLGSLEGDLTVTATDAAENSTSVAVKWYKGHAWSAWSQSADGTKHVHTCSRCGKTESETHGGGVATCVSEATCVVCGLEYGDKDVDNHVGTESIVWSSDSSDHWHECSECHEPWDGKTAHTFSWVRDIEPGYDVKGHEVYKCSVCGYVAQERDIDPLDPDYPAISGIVDGGCYDEAVTTFTVSYQGTGLTVTAGGKTLQPVDGKYTLPNDGANIVVTAKGDSGKSVSIKVSSYAGHEWGAYQSNADGTHVRACTHEGCGGIESGACAGDAATCVSASICKDCGYKITDVDPDNHAGEVSEKWSENEEGHWHECSACHARVDETDHDFETVSDGESGHHQKCKTCGYEAEVDEHNLKLTYEDESGHWYECEDCGYATSKVEHELTWVVTKEATATEDGLKHQECSECGYRGADVVIPKTGGDGSDDDDKGDGSGDKGGSGGKSDGSKDGSDAKKLPATGDPALAVGGVAAAGAALAALGLKRRK